MTHHCTFGYLPQCSACGPRSANLHREIEDELAKPSGPLFQDCATAPDDECCRQLHYFPINANNYYADDATGCEAVCVSLERVGENGACLPEDADCANWATRENWPKDNSDNTMTTSVGAYCACDMPRCILRASVHT
jgi:hypothetical protein